MDTRQILEQVGGIHGGMRSSDVMVRILQWVFTEFVVRDGNVAPLCHTTSMTTETMYEWCVMHPVYPDEPHRGPMREELAREWIREAKEERFPPGGFYLACRSVGCWEQIDV